MSGKYKFYSSQFKYEVLKAYKNEDYTIKELCSKCRIADVTLYDWAEKYEKYGLNGLENSRTWKSYSKALIQAAVKDYISGEYSQLDVICYQAPNDQRFLAF
ncbi:hypothetical protein J32TS6_32280 [Virgibacillus pantothenticus]|uniref:Insertion element IS150 protein InsJ-like helix-turn-helix domain-containing protein n=1 Tax=Virgibacillus pantothenticus TaxID=1473 RepID=A0A0L0QL28_VIRPA|nr:hypothetical protein AFK71_11800 [Virgibacillus pantothenticus]MBS7427424.1 helix-turn-helix domain-containing protein [Virgibacillus sp. 19R1-5]MBU8568874.1 transposase [Virgibacillus pantothenticus]MBU8602130.1 transposase [Virgibacillus pantothenticus]MBU8637010.1 transposase [Virgibacillus pantothenticus]